MLIPLETTEAAALGADERLADYTRLTDVALRRRLEVERGLYMAESIEVLRRALAAGHTPRSLLLARRRAVELAPLLDTLDPDVPVYVADEPVLGAVAGFRVHRGVLAAMHRPQLPDLDAVLAGARREVAFEDRADRADAGCSTPDGGRKGSPGVPRRSRIAVLEDLVDHTNVGACFRSAAAMGVDAVLVTPRCADPLYRRAVRVSMGTVFQVPWTRIEPWPEGIEALRDAGYVVAGMTLGQETITLEDLVAEDHASLALVFGNEGHGLTAAADRRLDRRVTIPMMHGVDSLNVAASSAVAFYATR